MSDAQFDQKAWLKRIGYSGPVTPTLETLNRLILAHSHAISYETLKEKNMYGKKVMGVARMTFIIGPDGKIIHIFEKVKPEGHAEEVLEYLKGAMKGAA